MKKLLILFFLTIFVCVGCALKDPGSQYDLAPAPGFRMGDKDQLTALASGDMFLVEDVSVADITKYTTMDDINTYIENLYCLKSILGESIGATLLLDGTTLKASAILQKYHGVDPPPDVLAMLGSANDTALRTEIGCGTAATRDADQDLESSDDVTFNKVTVIEELIIGASANPLIRFRDSDSPGTDKFTGNINMPYVRGTDGNETAWMYFRCMEDGSNTTQATYNGNETIWELDGNFLELPKGTADVVLPQVGAVHFNETDEQLSIHSGTKGEISGEAAISLIYHRTWSFDPDAVCDGAVDRLFLMTIGDDAPEGIIIDEWKVSFEADPTTEAKVSLKYADAFIGVANAAVIDDCNTTSGTSSEDTDANINSGNAVANSKVTYLEFTTAYTETTHQIIFELWYHLEED